ncbi:HelD family protein [Evansella cellulosilytica]|nr:3'-5' exonuclease [Evansella cellulosilytica]
MDKEIKLEQKKFDETVKKISDRSYYISEIINRKRNSFRKRENSVGDEIVYSRAKIDEQNLLKAKKEPFFGKLDIDDGDRESFYIGKYGVRDLDENLIVVDWRMPMASVFYNFTPGESLQTISFEDKYGRKITNEVEVLRKREFTIKDAKIIKMIQQVADPDSKLNITKSDKGEELNVTDAFLQDILEKSETTGYLKEIIATIQKEQDKAIRQPIDRNVLIQGVAGSGKSSIALHRLSFLLFNNKNLKPEDILILGPSNLFISSFKGLLPELDLEGIQQSTFYDLVMPYLKTYVKKKIVNSNHHYFENILFQKNRDEQKRIAFKGSASFAMLIDIYVEEMKVNYLNQLKPIEIFGERLNPKELEEIYNGYEYLPFSKRVQRFLEHVEGYYNDLLKKKIKEIDNQNDFAKGYLENGGLPSEEERKFKIKLNFVKDYKIKQLKKEVMENYTSWKNLMMIDGALTVYKRILNPLFLEVYKHELGEEIHELFHKNDEKDVTVFDLAPLYYIHLLIHGIDKKYSHIVVDEAQDLSFIHFAIFKTITKTMTILGDKEQSIFMDYGQNNWSEILDSFFEKNGNDMYLSMETSYRSTKEIIDTANKVLTNQFGKNHKGITPLNRKGSEVSYTRVNSGRELVDGIILQVEEWMKQYKRIAIIHKDEAKAKRLTEHLKKEYSNEVIYINPEQEFTQTRINVLSSYNSKGMEFDAVLLVNGNEETFPKDDLHAKLLYVLLTRAQQAVKVFYQGTPSPLLEGLIIEEKQLATELDDIL